MSPLKQLRNRGFTIVELLIVIVVIGILAGITVVAYNGIQSRAGVTALKSDLTQARTKLEIYKVTNADQYPATEQDVKDLLGLDSGTKVEYTSENSNMAYRLTVSSDQAKTSFYVDSADGTISDGPSSGHVGYSGGEAAPDPNWLTIDTQTWAKANLNVGTRIAGLSNQTNNSILEKYCYNDDEANCTTYGGLYQWNEAMQYVTTNGAQGICPAGSHIPTDGEWTILTNYLGPTTAGTQLQPGGTSGLEVPLAGFRYTDGSFYYLSSDANLWSSSESSSSAWYRLLDSGDAAVYRLTDDKALGFSVRCLEN